MVVAERPPADVQAAVVVFEWRLKRRQAASPDAPLARYAADPVALAEAAGLDPDPWQRDVLCSTASRILLNVTRQGGKSSVTAVLAIHTAIAEPGALVLLLSPSLRQSQELFRKCLAVYAVLEKSAPLEAESALRLELQNGARIVALPGTERTIRGYSGARLLVLDEASRIDDALYYALRPMLAVSGGRLIMLSTPWGKRGVFFHEWAEGQGWERQEVHANECPRITAEFLADEKVALPGFIYRQEYLCSFEENEQSVFAYADIQGAVTASIEPLELWG